MGAPHAESICADFLFRRARGQTVDVESMCVEHPEQATELRALFAIWRQTELGEGAADEFPSAAVSTTYACGEEIAYEAWESFLERLESRGPAHRRYVRQGEVARGGMGAIHQIYDTDIRRQLAMKVILEQDEQGSASGSCSS